MAINRWMGQENVAYTYNEILFSLEKGNPAMCKNVDEPGDRYAKWDKPNT